MERLDLDPALGREGDVLPDRVRVEAIDPEHRVIRPVADPVGSEVMRSSVFPYTLNRPFYGGCEYCVLTGS